MTDIIENKLEKMMEKLNPKARYTSELHVEEYNEEIYKEIINGDIEIPKKRENFSKNPEKNDWEDALRKKILQKAGKEKQQLEHKLYYINNSIKSIKNYDKLRSAVRSPRSMRESYSMGNSRANEEKWREQIKRREEEIEMKKKRVEEEKQRKMDQEKQNEERRKSEMVEKKKQQILEHMKSIEERMKERQEFVKVGNQRYSRVKKEKSMYEKINESFEERQSSFLEEKKKKLAEIRSFYKPIDEKELNDHEQRFLQLKKQKEELRERERKMNESRSQSYSSHYEGRFYRQIAEQVRSSEENTSLIKHDKMKQFSDHVRDHYIPKISKEKRSEIDEAIEKDKHKEEERKEKQRELLERSKVKGQETLEFLRSLPKKPKDKQRSTQQIPKQEVVGGYKLYTNYLTHHSEGKKNGSEKFKNILTSSRDRESKALQIQYQSKRMEEELKRKEKHLKYVSANKEEKDKIDDDYFSMIKAKLDLLNS